MQAIWLQALEQKLPLRLETVWSDSYFSKLGSKPRQH